MSRALATLCLAWLALALSWQACHAADCVQETGYDYSGGDLSNGAFDGINNAQACCNKCATNWACRAWTWNSANKRCYLKNNAFRRVAYSEAISGKLATCVDQYSSSKCAEWKENGRCENTWMSSNRYIGTSLCPLTCGRCGCHDLKPQSTCSFWKVMGYCNTRYSGLPSQRIGSYWCPATCGTCAGPQANWATSKPGQYHVGGVGVYVYKTVTAFQDHILPLLELHKGAHYYVQAPFTSAYNAASGIAYLPVAMDLKGRRIACVSFSVLSKHSVDFGIENRGAGWFAFGYSGYDDKSAGVSQAYINAYKVEMKMNIYMDTMDRVKCSYSFFDKSGRLLGTKTLSFSRPLGSFFFQTSPGSKVPIARFVRFQSLLANEGANDAYGDTADMSMMNLSRIYVLKLYHRSNRVWQDWSMSRIEHAWSVQTANIGHLSISPSTSPTSDTFTAIQQWWYK